MALSVAKTNAYAVVGPPEGLSAAKASVYAVLGPPLGLSAAKANVYAVLDNPSAPAWPSFSFGSGSVGFAYSQSFTATGSSPITYSVLSGSLPAGLSLAGNTISGTATAAGTSSFTLRATNAYGTADQAFSIVIAAPLSCPVAYAWSY